MGSQGPRTLTLTRERLELPEVEGRLLPSGFGYILLNGFSRDVHTQIREQLDTLTEEGATGVIFDLRGDPGGLLNEAVDVASLFIEDGTIVSVDDGDGVETYEARGDASEVPLVVLIDEYSASASEIVAGALADAERAVLVGESTFGKGTVQTVLHIGEGGVKFTTAEYFTPSGDSIEGVGSCPTSRSTAHLEEVLAAGEAELRRSWPARPPTTGADRRCLARTRAVASARTPARPSRRTGAPATTTRSTTPSRSVWCSPAPR